MWLHAAEYFLIHPLSSAEVKNITKTKQKPTIQQTQIQPLHVLLTGEFLFSKTAAGMSIPPLPLDVHG